MASEYGGQASDWVKKTSSNYMTTDGFNFETHWEENLSSGFRINIKTKIGEIKTPTKESLNPRDPNHR